MGIEHNLEYVLTRPGALKLTTVIIGLVASILSSHSYGESPYTNYYEDDIDRSRNDTNGTLPPGTEQELSNMSLTFIILGISIVYLAAHSLFYVITESRLNKFIDTAFHMSGGLFLFAGGILLINSAVNIDRIGCIMYQHDHGTHNSTHPHYPSSFETFLTVFNKKAWPYRRLPYEEEGFCHYFGEKIVGGCFNIVNAVIYAVLGYIIFTTDIEQM